MPVRVMAPGHIDLAVGQRVRISVPISRSSERFASAVQVLVGALGQALGAPASENCIRPTSGQPKDDFAAVEATIRLSPAMQVGLRLLLVSVVTGLGKFSWSSKYVRNTRASC